MHLILDQRSGSTGKPHKSRYPSKWVIIGIVSSIILVFIIAIVLYIIYRNRCKHKTPIPLPRNNNYAQSSPESGELIRNG